MILEGMLSNSTFNLLADAVDAAMRELQIVDKKDLKALAKGIVLMRFAHTAPTVPLSFYQ
jgi:hypothetical protein